jgi:hypothetical protein
MKPMVVAAGMIMLFQLVTPYWWWIMVVPFGIGLAYPMSAWQAVRAGAFSSGGVWFVSAGILLLTNSQIIASRIALMMNLGSGWMVLLVTVGVAALVGGVSGSAGQALRGTVLRKKSGSPMGG